MLEFFVAATVVVYLLLIGGCFWLVIRMFKPPKRTGDEINEPSRSTKR